MRLTLRYTKGKFWVYQKLSVNKIGEYMPNFWMGMNGQA